jgi:hypothetical protein
MKQTEKAERISDEISTKMLELAEEEETIVRLNRAILLKHGEHKSMMDPLLEKAEVSCRDPETV